MEKPSSPQSDVETESVEPSPEVLCPTLVAFCDGASFHVEMPREPFTVGRASGSLLVIDHPSVSRSHVRIHPGVPIRIEDLKSRNGTSVRGVRLEPHQPVTLRAGDVVECGDAVLFVRVGHELGLTAGGLAMVIGEDARWFEPPGGSRMNLGRRGPMRRLLLALAEKSIASPGVGLTVGELMTAAWPGERMQHEAGVARVYTTVQRLRALGLKDAIITRDDGYLIDPALVVRFAD